MQRATPIRHAVIAVTLVTVGCMGTGDDYLSPQLRDRVEDLKRGVAAEATTSANYVGRAEILWAWGNAYSLSGRTLPGDVPTAVMRAKRAQALGSDPPPRALAEIDRLVHELQINDEDPNAIGRVTLGSSEPLVAGGWATVEQTYTVGSLAMAEGGVFLLGAQIMADQGKLQHEDPTADNYVSLRASSSQARFDEIRIPLSGRHGGFKEAEPMVAFRLTGATLLPGETVTFVYGDRTEGSRGFRVQTMVTERLLLPIYLDLEATGALFSAEWPALSVIGQPEVRAVRGFAPSVVGVGEPFELAVRSEDAYTNRTSGPVPEYVVSLNGTEVRKLPAGSDAVSVLGDLRIDEAGTYRFTFRSADGAVTGSSNPLRVMSDPEARLYWGETHGHAGYAEGQGSAEQFYRFARDDARLDFVALTDHDSSTDDFEWKQQQDLVAAFLDEGRFVPFLGWEWSATRELGGHHNVLFRTPDRDRVPLQEASHLALLYEGLHRENAAQDVLIIPHAHQAGDWTHSDHELERLVEIYSMHGTFEWFGNLYLKNGFEIGFISASDDHRTKPGYAPGLFFSPQVQSGGLAAVYAATKTSDAIFDALRGLSAYATSGERIILDAELNGHRMGSRQPSADRRRIACKVMGTSPIDRIDVIKNGELAFSRSYLAAPLRSHSWIEIGFESSSEVFPPPRDNPRVYRVWSGSVEVGGARLRSVRSPGLKNRYLEWAQIDETKPGRVRFYAETRGRLDTILLELEGASAATVLRFRLEPARESGFAPPLLREPADLPGVDVELRLGDLRESRLAHELPVGPHTDRLSLQVVDPEAPLDQDFEFVDLENAEEGDYYYVRVTQLDGGRAWSSPFWVGGVRRQAASPPATTSGR